MSNQECEPQGLLDGNLSRVSRFLFCLLASYVVFLSTATVLTLFLSVVRIPITQLPAIGRDCCGRVWRFLRPCNEPAVSRGPDSDKRRRQAAESSQIGGRSRTIFCWEALESEAPNQSGIGLDGEVQYFQLSYTHQAKGHTQYVPPEHRKVVDRQLANYRKFRTVCQTATNCDLTHEWVNLGIELCKLGTETEQKS